MKSLVSNLIKFSAYMLIGIAGLYGCASAPSASAPQAGEAVQPTESVYVIGAGDKLSIYVWRHPDISVEVPVRPDGKISMPLIEDMVAVGKTPTKLGDDIEEKLAKYIKNPLVNVVVTNFVGAFGEQIKVVGAASEPKALAYREDITVLDVMIEVGGLAEFAAGNRAKIIRRTKTGEQEIHLRLSDLLNKGDIKQNIKMAPGDVLIIPETWF